MPESLPTRETTAQLAARVYALVRACPAGRATTYGWLASAVGFPKGARMVGWFMNETPKSPGIPDIPAHRVINSKGELSGSWAFGQRGRMRKLLEEEGVVFDAKDHVDLKRYGWDPMRDLTDDERAAILTQAEAAPPTPPSDNLMRLLLDDPASPFRLVRDDAPEG